MHSHLRAGAPSATRRMSLDTAISHDRFVVTERRAKSKSRRSAEAATGALIMLLFIAAYLQLFLPHSFFGTENSAAPFMVTASAVAAGLGLYLWMTRGFIPEFGIDRSRRELWSCMLNSKGHARVRRKYSTNDVKSIYVFRHDGQGSEAALFLRLKSRPAPVCLIRGHSDEIKSAHDSLCRFLRADQVAKPVITGQTARRSAPRKSPSLFAHPERS